MPATVRNAVRSSTAAVNPTPHCLQKTHPSRTPALQFGHRCGALSEAACSPHCLQNIQPRFTVALQEIQSFVNYEYVIINRDIDEAIRVLASIILEKRHRQGRMRDQVAVVLEGFQPKLSQT